MPRMPLFKRRMLEWRKTLDDRLLSSETIDTYTASVNLAYKFAKGSGWPSNPKMIEPKHIRDYYESLAGKATATQSNYTTALLLFLKFCKNKRIENVSLRIKVARTRVDWLSEEEVALWICEAKTPQLRAMAVLLAYTGMRVGELVRLRTKDVKEDNLTVTGKGRKSRVIPLDCEFWQAISPYTQWRSYYPAHEKFLVYRKKSGELSGYTTSGVRSALIKQGLKLGLHTSPHTFRRSFGRHLYKRGCGLPELKNLMGHSKMEMTVQYLGIGEMDITEAINKFRPCYLSHVPTKEPVPGPMTKGADVTTGNQGPHSVGVGG